MDDLVELLTGTLVELVRGRVEAGQPFCVRWEHGPCDHHCLQEQQHEGGVEVGGDLAVSLAGTEADEFVAVRLGGHGRRVLVEHFSQEHAYQVGFVVVRLEVAKHRVGQRLARDVELALLGIPALQDGVVEALLAAEVVGDELLVESRSGGDGVGPGTGQALV